MRRQVVFCLALSLTSNAFAQTAPLGALRDPAFKADLIQALLGVADAIADKKREKEVDDQLDALAHQVRSQLQWTGQNGYLIEVRAFANADGKVVQYSSPMQCGVGETPVDALTACSARPVWRQGEPNGLRYSARDSYMVWATEGKGFLGLSKKLRYGVIPGAWTSLLHQEVATLIASDSVMQELDRTRQSRLMANMVEEAGRQMRDTQARATLSQNYASLNEQRKKIGKIDAELNRELKRVARANAAMRQLDLLGNVLTVAQNVGELYDMMGEPRGDDSSLSLDSNQAARNWLTNFSGKAEADVNRLQTERAKGVTIENNLRIQIINVINQQGAPQLLH